MSRGLVIAGCLSGEKDDAGVEALVGELSRAVGADVTVRARTGGRPVGDTVPEALCELRAAGVGSALVVTTHLVDGRLARLCAEAVRDAAPGFESLRLAPALLMALGTHARRDVLADLAGRLRVSGTFVTPWPHSLSELPAVRGLVVAHALSTLE